MFAIIETQEQLNHTYLNACIWESWDEIIAQHGILATGMWLFYENLNIKVADCFIDGQPRLIVERLGA